MISEKRLPVIDASVPHGMTLTRSVDGALVIVHRRSGMGCMNTFLIVWLTTWTGGCILLLHQYLNGETMDGGSGVPLWFVSAFCAADLVTAAIIVYLLWSVKTFRLDPERLVIEVSLIGIKRRTVIPRSSIRRLVQVKDGGTGEDSFPSWGLVMEASRKRTLLFRQPHAKSAWLGAILADWAGVEFVVIPEK